MAEPVRAVVDEDAINASPGPMAAQDGSAPNPYQMRRWIGKLGMFLWSQLPRTVSRCGTTSQVCPGKNQRQPR